MDLLKTVPEDIENVLNTLKSKYYYHYDAENGIFFKKGYEELMPNFENKIFRYYKIESRHIIIEKNCCRCKITLICDAADAEENLRLFFFFSQKRMRFIIDCYTDAVFVCSYDCERSDIADLIVNKKANCSFQPGFAAVKN